VDQEELLIASKRDCDALQAEIARIQGENDSAKVRLRGLVARGLVVRGLVVH